MSTKDALTVAFSNFNKQQIDNVKHHLKVGTRILCGVEAHIFTDGKGGA